ncbi:MAG: YkgJ family cysteine cluster protein [Planctomycetota bacterium]|jgi:Fe-S-cluster containining protein
MIPKRTSTAQEWYAEGLRFECTQCGNCCTGPPGTVWFTPAEAKRMATGLGLEPEAFHERYARVVDGRWSLRERRTPAGFDCVFLDRASAPEGAVCSIYEVRPAQCRTWPFWPENLASKRVWETVKRRTPCPGMGEGPVIPAEKIRNLRDATPES